MLDVDAMRKLLAEEYGISNDMELEAALKNGGIKIGVFTTTNADNARRKKPEKKPA